MEAEEDTHYKFSENRLPAEETKEEETEDDFFQIMQDQEDQAVAEANFESRVIDNLARQQISGIRSDMPSIFESNPLSKSEFAQNKW